MPRNQNYGSFIVDSKKKFSASVKPGKAIIGEYLLWAAKEKLGVKGLKRSYVRFGLLEDKSERDFVRASIELEKLRSSEHADSADLKKSLIHVQKCVLTVSEIKWKKTILLFKYRKELALSREEIHTLRKRLKVLQNGIRNIYGEIERIKEADYLE